MADTRLQCAEILQKILEEKVFFAELKKQISEKDLPYANMLVLTTLRRLLGLKKVLTGFVNKKIPHKHRLAEYLLLNATAEILFMQTAEYAVINETVKNIRRSCDKFLAGMANAILRKVCTQKEELLKKVEAFNLLPDSFMEILQGYEKEQIVQIASSLNVLPPLDITAKKNPQDLVQKMQSEIMPNGSLRLYNAPKIAQLPEYAAGSWWVQDVAASLPVMAMGEIAGKKVVDLCAAPGGKTAQLCAAGAEVTALDISAPRLEILQQNMQRLGFSGVKTKVIDALKFLQTSTEQFDAVLLDAPCSASGTLRRHPEVVHIKTMQDVLEQAKLQKKLLENCKNILKIGGILVYSVCSACQIEGERQIAEFLHQNPQFKLVPIKQAEISTFGTWQNELITADGAIRTLPYYQSSQGGMDSFYICKMQRII